MSSMICENGVRGCAAVRPCQKCILFMMVNVLPFAMRQGGFGGSEEQAKAFFQGFTKSWENVMGKSASPPAPPPPPTSKVQVVDMVEDPAHGGTSPAQSSSPLFPKQGIRRAVKAAQTAPGKSRSFKSGKKGPKMVRGALTRLARKQATSLREANHESNGTSASGAAHGESSREGTKKEESE